MAALQVIGRTRCARTAPWCAQGIVIPVGLRVEHHASLRIEVPIDPHGEVVDSIRCARASPWNAAEIAIKEIDGTVRGKVLAGIPDGEFPGAWAPLAGDGGKGVRRVHRRVEPLVFAG